MPSLPVQSSISIIIGGTHGIGLATARLLLTRGSTVLLTGRDTARLNAAKAELGNNVLIHKVDITSLASIQALKSFITTSFSPTPCIDLLFINAGHAHLSPFALVTEPSFAKTFSTNVFGAFFSAQALAPLIKDGGSIVFTTSIANRRGIPGMSVYAASKAAVHSLVQSLAAELAPRGVRVNAVSPGYIGTPTMGIEGASEEEVGAFAVEGAGMTPLGRIGDAEEVARAVVWVGFEATFSTGSEVVVDGGLMACVKVEG